MAKVKIYEKSGKVHYFTDNKGASLCIAPNSEVTVDREIVPDVVYREAALGKLAVTNVTEEPIKQTSKSTESSAKSSNKKSTKN